VLVLLDRFPLDDHDQWMVAAHVGLNPSGKALLLRHTTFLPNQHGLGALLAMVFAPRVEMRTNVRREAYTGCLIGLGDRKKDWGKSSRLGGVENTVRVRYNSNFNVSALLEN
jgi:hypothetical protein